MKDNSYFSKFSYDRKIFLSVCLFYMFFPGLYIIYSGLILGHARNFESSNLLKVYIAFPNVFFVVILYSIYFLYYTRLFWFVFLVVTVPWTVFIISWAWERQWFRCD